jgi:putative ATPase
MPGCRAPLTELVTYLAEALKSTRAYEGYNSAERLVKRDPTLLVPIAMRDIPVQTLEVIGDGNAYKCQLEYVCVGSHLELEQIGAVPIDLGFRHPVTNEYLPSRVQGEIILRKEGDLSDKLWDEVALRRWEELENGEREWTGRQPSRD